MNSSLSITNDKYENYKLQFQHFLKLKDIQNYGTIIVDLSLFKPSIEKNRYTQLTEYILYLALQALKISEKYKHNHLNVYVNLTNCSINNFSLKYFKYINQILADALPERLLLCTVYSNSKLYGLLWAMVQKHIDKDTRKKFKFTKKNQINVDYIFS
tara:strand:- start:835 stop:1305 length:471 start_codon:yes stop_codon:yes gene_type:complete